MTTICEDSLQYFPSNREIEDLRSTYIANCVFNNFLCFTAILLNIGTIHAIRKTPSLPITLKTLLFSLAVSDVGVGLLVQPFYTALLVNWLQHNVRCINNVTFHNILCMFSVASFSGVVAVSVDRFMAIHLHLRYQEHVTHKRVVSLVISIWLISLVTALTPLWLPSEIFNPIIVILAVLGLVFIAWSTLGFILPYDATTDKYTLSNYNTEQRQAKGYILRSSLNLLLVHFMYTFSYSFVIYLT